MLQSARLFINQLYGKCQTFFKERPDANTLAFAKHNRSVWSGYRDHGKDDGQVLIEGNRIPSCIVGMSYVAPYLGRKHHAEICVFTKGMSRRNKAAFASFADSFLIYSRERDWKESERVLQDVVPTLKCKRDLESLAVAGLLIGDLVYDAFLRRYECVTVDLTDSRLLNLLHEAIAYLLFWRRHIADHQVRAVLVSHCVYPWAGVITRVAIENQIPVYMVAANRVYCVTNSYNGRPYNEFLDHPENFAALTEKQRDDALKAGRRGLEKRFRGERDVGAHRQINITYKARTGVRILAESPRKKILVASHCFSDDNHVFGNNLFPDIYEWMEFLGGVSERTDYDWYIKLHPDRYDWETSHVLDFVKRFPRFTLLPADASHHQIIEDGLDCALTVYGSISFEYAALGVPVITASQWTPTVRYDFNLHPKTVNEYERLLLSLDFSTLNIRKEKVYEYYFCHFLDDADPWLYKSFEELNEIIMKKGGAGALSSVSYNIFLEQFSPERHQIILATVQNFIESGDYSLRRRHITKLSTP